MNNYIILAALIVAMLSFVVAGIIYIRFRQMEQRKNRDIVQGIREQDRIARELKHTRIEKNTLEGLLRIKMGETGQFRGEAADTTNIE